MKESASERRLAENEVVFRRANEKVQEGLSETRKDELADKVKRTPSDLPLHFYCECADDQCLERIILTPSKFKALHKNSAQFVIFPGHQIPKIEKVIKKNSSYYVVEKYMQPPTGSATLHSKKQNLNK